MAFSTDAISNWFLNRADEDKTGLSPMKLQKLLYYAHGWYLANAKDALIEEEPQAWEFGPVFPTAYHEFKQHGNQTITTRAVEVDVDGGRLSFKEPSVAEEATRKGLNAELAEDVLEQVWDLYGKVSAPQLSNLTHREGTPWDTVRKEAMKRFQGQIPQGLNIPNEVIQAWFEQKLATLT